MCRFWKDYYAYWDDFNRQWFANKACPWNDVSRAFAATGALDFDELPDPYLGAPENGVRAVMININPGGSQANETNDLEATKRYSRLDGEAWLLREFRDRYNCCYSRYIAPDAYSCLNPELKKRIGQDNDVCGVNWWQGTRSPLPWLSRIYGMPVGPSDVFAPEFCPFHSVSQRFSLRKLVKSGVSPDWFKEHVLLPSCKAARDSRLPFVVGVGKIVADALETLGYKLQKVFDKTSGGKSWPRNGKGELVKRKYFVYDVENVPFVITSAQGSNSRPSEDFRVVEAGIRRYVAGLKCAAII